MNAGHNNADLKKSLRMDALKVTRPSTYLVLVLRALFDMAPHSADVEAAFLRTGEAERLKPLFGFADSPRVWRPTFREKLTDLTLNIRGVQMLFLAGPVGPRFVLCSRPCLRACGRSGGSRGRLAVWNSGVLPGGAASPPSSCFPTATL